jgi:uncharacterized low-complexity protein
MESNHMSRHEKHLKPMSLAIGATLVAGMAASGIASAANSHANPFAMSDVHGSYTQLAEKAKDGKCGEGKCGADKLKAKQKAKEGKCGESKAKVKEGKCGESKAKVKEGKCGESKAAPKEGKCGGAK